MLQKINCNLFILSNYAYIKLVLLKINKKFKGAVTK